MRKNRAPWRAMDLLAQMATFVKVVEGKSLSSAARAQRMSLPAVSRQLRALEEDLGAPLIVRSTRRLHVTDAGRRWYDHAVRLLRDLEAARADVRPSATASGRLVVSASLTFGTVIVIPRLRKLAERHPRLVIDLRLEDHLVDLVGEGVDVAIRAGSPPPDTTTLVAHPIFSMTRVVVASPRWLKKHGVPRSPAELSGAECLLQITPAGSLIPWALRRDEEEVTPAVRGRLRTSAPLALRQLALDAAGPALLPDWLVAADVEQGRLRRVLPQWCSAPITAWAIHRAELRSAPRLRALLEALPPRAR